MYDQSPIIPYHIKEMLVDLQTHPYGDSVLSKYHCKTITDPKLSQIYTSLNYPSFSQIPSKSILNLIHTEYLQDFPTLDPEPVNFLSSYTQVYHESQICLFSDPVDLNFSSIDLFDADSLNSLWSDCTRSSPNKPRTPVPKTTPRSRNGLKMLSWKVKEITEKLGNASYQEIADCLVKETEDSEIGEKDEKNIRRRVYDALNVLISVGVLQKDNRKVQAVKGASGPAAEKVRRLKSLVEQYLALRGLIERNRTGKSGPQRVFLPFNLIAVGTKNEKSANVSITLLKHSACFRVCPEFIFQHSDELLTRISTPINCNWIPESLVRFFNLDRAVIDDDDYNIIS